MASATAPAAASTSSIAPRREGAGRGLGDRGVGDGIGELVGARGVRQIERELEIEHEALADLGLVLHHAVMGVDQRAR